VQQLSEDRTSVEGIAGGDQGLSAEELGSDAQAAGEGEVVQEICCLARLVGHQRLGSQPACVRVEGALLNVTQSALGLVGLTELQVTCPGYQPLFVGVGCGDVGEHLLAAPAAHGGRDLFWEGAGGDHEQ